MNFYDIVFSPTGGTEKIVNCLISALEKMLLPSI